VIAMHRQIQRTRSIKLQNKKEGSIKLADFLHNCAITYKIPDSAYNDLRLVIEEVFVNITSYAYDKDGIQMITVDLNDIDDGVSITFTDTGAAFNPLSYTCDDIESADHSEGGMGINIIRSLTDQQQYDRVGQSNVFTVTKHYTKSHNK